MRNIWSDHLNKILIILNERNNINQLGPLSAAQKKEIVSDGLRSAPVMKLSGTIDIGITMRIASVEQTKGGISVGLGVGPIGINGQFGFMQSSTSESVMQVRAQYTMSNDDVTLTEYLGKSQITLTEPTQLNHAIKFLEKINEVETQAEE